MKPRLTVGDLTEARKKAILLLGQAQQEHDGQEVAAMWLDGGCTKDAAKGYGVTLAGLSRIRPPAVLMISQKPRVPVTGEPRPSRLYQLSEDGWRLFKQISQGA